MVTGLQYSPNGPTHQSMVTGVAHWLGARLLVYVGVAAGSAIAFLIAAGLYVAFIPAPENIPNPTPVQSPMPAKAPASNPAVPSPSSSPAPLVASNTPTILLSNILGSPIYDQNNQRVGGVADIVMNSSGGAAKLIVELNSASGSKEIAIDFSTIRWAQPARDSGKTTSYDSLTTATSSSGGVSTTGGTSGAGISAGVTGSTMADPNNCRAASNSNATDRDVQSVCIHSDKPGGWAGMIDLNAADLEKIPSFQP
jgi:sporulation protein YlmC with PRC-barrel domain